MKRKQSAGPGMGLCVKRSELLYWSDAWHVQHMEATISTMIIVINITTIIIIIIIVIITIIVKYILWYA